MFKKSINEYIPMHSAYTRIQKSTAETVLNVSYLPGERSLRT